MDNEHSMMHADPVVILLVEDNPADVRLTQMALKKGKIHNELIIARDGEQALDALHQRGNYQDTPRPEIILLDLNLPKIGGLEILKEIKAKEHLKRIPVVVLTSSKAEEDIVRSYDLHANCYITKPVDFTQFRQVINQLESFWFSIVRLSPQ
ncbi:MAG: response regulator [Magnetococcales bacterium]|nr:response regulator [Magnetococcales bacterium]